MADKKALDVFKTICDMLDSHHFNYVKDVEKLTVRITMSGKDFSMEFKLWLYEKSDIIIFDCTLPFKFCEEQRSNGALAVCYINYHLADGNFDCDVRDGRVKFRITTPYRGCNISTGVVDFMFNIACQTVDRYNGRLALVNQGKLDPKDITKNL